jgi:hypothetical protein
MVTIRQLAVALLLTLVASPLPAGEFRIGIGPLIFVEDGLDFHVSYRPEQSHWQYGLRVLRYTDEFTFHLTTLTKTTTTQVGPTLNYLFTPEQRGSWYVGVSLLYWEQLEKSTRTGTSDKDSTTAPFFGGGYTRKMGTAGYFNFGLFLTPVSLSTRTADSSEESTGADVQLQLGFAF